MVTIYLTPWIEVEYGWGDRPEGFLCFSSLSKMKKQTEKDFKNGNYSSGGGYCGPVKPFQFYEAEVDESLVKGKKFPFFLDNSVVRNLTLKQYVDGSKVA